MERLPAGNFARGLIRFGRRRLAFLWMGYPGYVIKLIQLLQLPGSKLGLRSPRFRTERSGKRHGAIRISIREAVKAELADGAWVGSTCFLKARFTSKVNGFARCALEGQALDLFRFLCHTLSTHVICSSPPSYPI